MMSVKTKAVLVQVAILAALVVWFKVAMPKIEKAREASAAAERERRILDFFDSTVVVNAPAENNSSNDSSGAQSPSSSQPQRLRLTPTVEDVEQQLGAPNANMTDFAGGQHLTWTGTAHKLEGSFNKGKLYALSLTDVESGHGTMVFESSAQWRKF